MDVNTIAQLLYQGTQHQIMLTNFGKIPFKPDFGGLELKSLWPPRTQRAIFQNQVFNDKHCNGFYKVF
jgi:hypothetical protein